MKEIRLTSGEIVIVDDELFETLSEYRWSIASGGYAQTKNGIRMHRLVIGARSGQMVDHVNRNRLDNRKKNLRFCTMQENRRNSAKKKGSASRFKGVMRVPSRPAWRAFIKYENKNQYLGYFKSEVEAALAYNKAAKEHFGEFALLNEI